MKPKITNDLVESIKLNLAKGWAVDAVAFVLIQQGHDQATAINLVKDIKNGKTITTEIELGVLPGKYTYEQPRIPTGKNYIDTDDKRVYIGTTLDKPRIITFENILSHTEADELIALAIQKELKRSKTGTGEGKESDVRTSDGVFIKHKSTPLITKLEQRIAQLLSWPAENCEQFNVIRYQPGGKYLPHMDSFTRENTKALSKAGQRIATLILYLSDVEQGGETNFPHLGFSLLPRKGNAIYFEYCNSLDEIDPLTLHTGMPVIQGEKWIATKWLRQRPVITPSA